MLKHSDTEAGAVVKALHWVRNAPLLPAKAMRYALVGVGNGVVFVAVSVVAVSVFDISPTWASGLGYLCAIPVSFVGHRTFTFQSTNAWAGEGIRFVLAHAVCLSVSMLVMSAVTAMQAPYAVGLIGAVLIIPALNFLIANFWVFAKRWKGRE